MSDNKEKPLLVAVVGSGPSGFYAAEALIKSDTNVRIDMFERLPSPYGLVRSGVAPDHQKLKQVIRIYQKIAAMPDFKLIANVTVGRDISVDELRRLYHAVIFCYGAETDRKLGVPGEDLNGSHTATEFVGWYNGHPDYQDRHFDLSSEVAVIIGQGNVAADVSRILAKTVDELKHTDIAQHALDALAESRVREIHVIGRRGPAQAKFTTRELREFGELGDCAPVVLAEDLELNAESQTELEDKGHATNKKIYGLFRDFSELPPSPQKSKKCFFKFLLGPKILEGSGKLERVVLERNKLSGAPFKQSAAGTGETIELETGLLFRSIGYHGLPMVGVPFDEKRGIIPNEKGRVRDNPQLYAAGWIKRGPSGIIGNNRACSVETVACLLEDKKKLADGTEKTGADGVYALLKERNIRPLGYDDWRKIDTAEISSGKTRGKPREKYVVVSEMLALIDNLGK